MADERDNQQAAPAAEGAAPKVEVSRTAPPLPEGKLWVWAVGRRKKATARVRVRPGKGLFTVNERQVDEFFTNERDRNIVRQPLTTVSMLKSWDIFINVGGGGFTGQAGAICLGLSRALAKAMPDIEGALRDQGLMTRDARMKERKKYGQKGARKRFQFSKR